MKFDLYKNIVNEARKMKDAYDEMNDKANYHLVEYERKEDNISYWIAVVAFNKGYNLGIDNEIQ